MNPGPAISALVISGRFSSSADDFRREVARLEARILGQNHRGVGGEVAVAGLARRLDHDAVELERAGSAPALASVSTASRTWAVKRSKTFMAA